MPLLDAAEGWESWNWEFVCEEKGVTITRTTIPNSSLKCTKGVALIRATPKEICDVVVRMDMYKKWDPKITESKQIHNLNETTSTNYFEFSPFFPVAGRDVCFLQHIHKQKNGSVIVGWHSAKDPDVSKKKGIVRASMGTSGFVITPIKSCVPLACLVTFVVQFDLKGWIPPAVMNSITAGQPMILFHIGEELKQLYPHHNQQQAQHMDTVPIQQADSTSSTPSLSESPSLSDDPTNLLEIQATKE